MNPRDGVISIAGSRKFDVRELHLIHAAIAEIMSNPFVREIRFGGALGVDTLALREAIRYTRRPRLVVVVPGKLWEQPGYAAGMARAADEVIELGLPSSVRDRYRKRNQHLVDACSMLWAFWNGDERSGTAMTMRMAAKKRIPVRVVRLDGGSK